MNSSSIGRLSSLIQLLRQKFVTIFFLFLLVSAATCDAKTDTQTMSFNIPASDLQTALNIFGRESGILLSFDPQIVNGFSTDGLKGEFTVLEGISQLLGNAELQVIGDGENAYRIVALQMSTINLAPIRIQGELIERSVQDSQTSVAIVTGETLEKRSDDNFEDIFERSAGVSVANGDLSLSIRGVDSNGPAGGGGPTISVNIDGSTITGVTRMNLLDYSTWDLQQVEVLRGPQSTQTGRNSLAGAVIVRSADPVFDNEFRLRGQFGESNTFQGALAANTVLIDDTLAARVSVDREQSDGFVTNDMVAGDEYDSEERTTIRASLLFEPTEDFSAILKVSRFKTIDGTGAVDASLFPEQRVNNFPIQERLTMETDSVNLRLFYDVTENLRLQSETSYFDNDTEFVVAGGVDDSAGRNFEQEIKLFYEAEHITAVAGVYYTDLSSGGSLGGAFPAFFFVPDAPAGSIINLAFISDSSTENYAVFGELEYKLSPKISLIGGVRYDNEEQEDINGTSLTSDDPSVSDSLGGTVPPTLLNASFSALLPKLAINYEISPDSSIGFTLQRGYRAGGAAINFNGEVYEFDPEYTWNYEIAYRSEWFEQRLIFNANAFYTDWTDQQVSQQGATNNTLDVITVNAGESRLIGGEIDLTSTPVDGLELYASIAYVEAEFTDFVTGGNDFTGNAFPFAPKLTSSIGAEYFFENGWFVASDTSFTDQSFRDIENTPALENNSRFLVNVRVGYEGDNWNVFAYATNLFDRDYWSRRDGDGTLRPGDPRQLGLIGQIEF
ncbi:MAG: TonB-dependent receptor [Pseudomonadota bacterium]